MPPGWPMKKRTSYALWESDWPMTEIQMPLNSGPACAPGPMALSTGPVQPSHAPVILPWANETEAVAPRSMIAAKKRVTFIGASKPGSLRKRGGKHCCWFGNIIELNLIPILFVRLRGFSEPHLLRLREVRFPHTRPCCSTRPCVSVREVSRTERRRVQPLRAERMERPVDRAQQVLARE